MHAWPGVVELPSSDAAAFLRRAEHHGVAGVVSDALLRAGVSIDRSVVARELARDLDHRAHLELLRTMDRALGIARIFAVPLKGPFFAERYYPRPAARVAGDTDLLVRERDLADVSRAFEAIGYTAASGPTEERFRDEHHHIHLTHQRALPLELHFHAYRGFGGTLRSDTFLERSLPYRDFRALRVLEPADELVYLAVHAAAHKFGRWSWLFDLRLLIDTVDDATITAAGQRAREFGFARPVALAARLLVSIMGMDPARLAPLGSLGSVRGALAERLLSTPEHPVARAASRLAYTTVLCPDASTSVRWVATELVRRGPALVCST